MTRYYSFINGVMLTGAIFFGFIQWYVIGQIKHIEQMDTSIQVIERRLDTLGAKTWFGKEKQNE